MASTPKRILVTTANWQGALCCVQSLGRLGHEVYVFDPGNTAPLFRSRYCAGHVRSLPESDPGYAASLIEALKRDRYDLLFPISDLATEAVAAAWDEVNRLTAVAMDTPANIRLALDKSETMRFAMKHGFDVPKSYFPKDEGEASELANTIEYPCVAKLPRGTGGGGVAVVHRPEELLAFFRERGSSDNWPFVQEFVPGEFYDVMAVCERGRMLGAFGLTAPLDIFPGGTPPYTYSVTNPELLESAGRLMAALNWQGPADIDYLRREDGRWCLLEINPRLSGTVNFAYKLGIDLPKLGMDVALGQAGPSLARVYPENFFFRSVYPMEFSWWRKKPFERLRYVLSRRLFGKVRTNIYWDDTALVAAQLREAVASFRRK